MMTLSLLDQGFYVSGVRSMRHVLQGLQAVGHLIGPLRRPARRRQWSPLRQTWLDSMGSAITMSTTDPSEPIEVLTNGTSLERSTTARTLFSLMSL